jgi:hypothetical protein
MQLKFKVLCVKWWGKWQEYGLLPSQNYGVIYVEANSGKERAFYHESA